MFALISSRSGLSAMILRSALQGHHGPLVKTFCLMDSVSQYINSNLVAFPFLHSVHKTEIMNKVCLL